jgi:hypothetical protein
MNEPNTFDAARRSFLLKLGAGLGWVSVAELLGTPAWAQQPAAGGVFSHGALTAPHFPPTAKRIIYLHMLGAISQVDTFDYKPTLEKMHGQELPESVRGNRRLSSMVAGRPVPGRGPAGQVSAGRRVV